MCHLVHRATDEVSNDCCRWWWKQGKILAGRVDTDKQVHRINKVEWTCQCLLPDALGSVNARANMAFCWLSKFRWPIKMLETNFVLNPYKEFPPGNRCTYSGSWGTRVWKCSLELFYKTRIVLHIDALLWHHHILVRICVLKCFTYRDPTILKKNGQNLWTPISKISPLTYFYCWVSNTLLWINKVFVVKIIDILQIFFLHILR